MRVKLFDRPEWQRFPTWVWERSFAILYVIALTTVAIFFDYQGVKDTIGEILCALGVLYTFAHMQVASRLEESQEKTEVTVECYAKLSRYLINKEVFWASGFGMLGAWAAFAGVPLFLLYSPWRKFYLKNRS